MDGAGRATDEAHTLLDMTGVSRSKVSSKAPKARLQAIFAQWINQIPVEILECISVSREHLQTAIPRTYTIYRPLLLLPKGTLQSPAWEEVWDVVGDIKKNYLLENIAKALDITHIAIESSVPLHDRETATPNVLRRPTGLRLLYGDFGPHVKGKPSASAFDEAFWVTAKQHGLHQVWAPRYTMFSRGNITEKKRIMDLPIAPPKPERHEQTTAVDLYAGIGYFVFPYVRAGCTKVLCWELNPWSVEGLRRGAMANKISCRFYRDEALSDNADACPLDGDATVVVFQEDNANAEGRVSTVRHRLPPIRHVNCGLLPTATARWTDSIKLIDSVLGGWIHVHETIHDRDWDTRVRDIVEFFSKHADDRTVRCEHVERVKSFAPGVTHCVLDIYLGPLQGL
ncbi:MAG: hypothetical protein M1817_005513 [Caeruleum heppii]|nr:MAG: hypothetical protein M1817_005513 [Caeruleum heppii]